MKKTLLSLIASALVIVACGQAVNPPKPVQDAFGKKFAQVKDAKWEQEGNEWEAEFKMNGTEMSASYDNSGNWLETETEVKKKDVPAEIFKAVNMKFDGWKIEEVERLEKPGFAGYELEIEKGETTNEILVSNEGVVTIKKENVEEDNDGED